MLTPDNVNTLFTVSGSIVVAIIGTIGGGALISRSKKKRIEATTEPEKDAIAQHAADPNMWVVAVTRDAAAAREDASAARIEAAEARAEASKLRSKFDQKDREERIFRVAINRYLTVIARAWGVEEEMPYPHEEDRHVLADVIPTIVEGSRPHPTHRSEKP